MSALQHQLAIAGPRAGFVTSRTKSGKSLGSLGHYSRDWNLADAEVTSELRLADRKSTRLNSSHITRSRMPSSA